jgi:hypothetical protein
MSGEIIPFNHNADNQLPAHLANVFGDEGNIAPRQSINQLSYRGKVWRRVVAGEETQLTRQSADTGEQEPIPIVQVILLDHNKQRSRSFFEGNYEDGKNSAPRCYSGDGIKPDASVKEPISATCATCPNAVKGSKITENGKQSTLCSPFKRVAVIPSANIGQHPPMLLKLAQTSIWDKDNPEEAKGWYAWDNYLDMLRARGAKHTGMVETRIKFDLRVAYPKLLFSAARWLSPEEALTAKQAIESMATDIEAIVNGAGNSDGVMGQPANGGVAAGGTNGGAQAAAAPAPTQAPAPAPTQAPAPVAAKKPAKPPAAPAPTPAPMKIVKKIDLAKTDGFSLEQMLESGWTEEQLIAEGMLLVVEEPVAPKGPPKPPAKPKGPPQPPAAPAPAPAATGDGDVFAAAAPTTPAAPASAPTVVSDTPAGLKDLLDGWDGDAE